MEINRPICSHGVRVKHYRLFRLICLMLLSTSQFTFVPLNQVKGQISDMALCTIDDETKISVLAKLFFTELARKGNALYNVMPDIISRLSDPDAGTEEDKFREIMKFIIGLIEKDKHLESLVEKLCQRFRVTKTERQWRDLVSS